MSNPTITLVMKDYDYIAPLVYGDVKAKGIDLHLDRSTSMLAGQADPAVQAVELSFSRYLIRMSQGNHDFVGIPVFVYRAFRHRCFFVLKDSGIKEFKDLEGKRIGTEAWPNTGNTWSRAALREQGVGIDKIRWWVGPVDDPSHGSGSPRSEIVDLPSNVEPGISPGQTLREMLLAGDLDALMCPWPPKGYYQADSQIVRLIPDYRKAEQAYFRRTGIYPGQHIIGLRREVFERDPWIAKSLYNALDQSMALWMKKRLKLAETTPWLLADIEDSMELIGSDWQPNGVEPNQKMIAGICEEEYAQNLITAPLDSTTVFAEFEQVMEK